VYLPVGDAVGFENAVQGLGTRFESDFFREDEGFVAVEEEMGYFRHTGSWGVYSSSETSNVDLFDGKGCCT
jgi:hypothetical protein